MQARGTTTAIFAIGLAATLLLVASTGAVVFDEPADRIDDDVALQPGDNPYAFLDENDELAIDITEDNPDTDADGVNPDAFSAQHALFYITYDGDGYAEAWIDHDAEAITFVVDGDPVESPEEAALLTPVDDAVPVGVEIDTRIVDATPGDRLIDSISVHAKTAEPKDPDDDGDDDASSGTSAPIVSIEQPTPSVREVELRSVVGGGDTDVDLKRLHVGDPAIRLDRLRFVRDAPGDVAFRVAGTAGPPAGVPSLPAGVDALGFYEVAFAEPDQPIDEATATISVDRDRLDEVGVDPERLAVYHETADGWAAAETTVIHADDEAVRIEADSEGFSAFAVGVERPALAPEEATLSAETIDPGEELHVDVTLANVGPAPATGESLTLRAEWASNGENENAEQSVVTEQLTVDADAGETVTRSVTLVFDEPGEYELVVDGDAVAEPTTVDGATVTESTSAGANIGGGVEGDIGTGAGGDAGSGPGDGGDGAVEEITGFDLSDLVGLATLVGLVLATLFLVRRAPR